MLSRVRCVKLQTFHFGQRSVSTGLKILVFSNSDFGQHTLESLYDDSKQERIVQSVHLITGKNTPMQELAERLSIPILPYPPRLERGQYDVGVVISFGHLIPGRIIEQFPYGVLNVHPSLLPRWRGAAPITHTILSGDTVTGVSIMAIRPKRFDIGPVLLQETLPVPDACTTRALSDQLSRLGAGMLLNTLSNLNNAQSREQAQSDEGASYAHKITTDMSFVSWCQQTRLEIDRQYRALYESTPLRSRYLGKPIQLLDMVPLNSLKMDHNMEDPYGTVKYSKNPESVCIRCKDGWVAFENVVYKKRMTAASFHNGYLSKDCNRGVVLESVENTLLKFTHQAKMRS